MKARHAAVLADFEASSVILFAALVAGDFSLSSRAPSAPPERVAILSPARPAFTPSRVAASIEAAKAAPAGAERPPRGKQRTFSGSAVALAIEQMKSGQLQGFVPFERPA